MPLVTTAVRIEGVSINDVWPVVCDFEAYPRLMADVLEVTVLTREVNRCTSSWKVLLNGSELTWIEEDVFDPRKRIEFAQTEGDLEVYRGEWRLEPAAGAVVVTLEIEFDIGIPSLEELLNPIAIKAIHSNSQQMLSAIKRRSE